MRLRVIGTATALVLAGAAAVIQPWEGLSLTGYADPIGIPTDCWGNTHGAVVGKTRTLAECEAMLQAEVRQTADRLGACITREVTANQAAALLSWAYNVGTGAACGSTLVRMLNAGEPATRWCEQLTRWDYAGGKRLRGLTRRRAHEREICLGAAPVPAFTTGDTF
jgi:lysozyme